MVTIPGACGQDHFSKDPNKLQEQNFHWSWEHSPFAKQAHASNTETLVCTSIKMRLAY